MPSSLRIALQNNSDTAEEVWAYVTGMALQHGGRRCLLRADGRSLYFPRSPPSILSPLEADCAIALNNPPTPTAGPGSGSGSGSDPGPRTVEIPQMAGGRVWISRGSRLTFLLNPNPADPDGEPALVEPSVLNPSDANAAVDFAFAEFTLNDAQLYANISYVDFVPRLPVALHLRTSSGVTADQVVAGMPPDGADRLAAALRDQAARDGRPWDRLVVPLPGSGSGSGSDGDGSGGTNKKTLRVLNATHGGAVGAAFDGYFEPYVAEVLAHFDDEQQQQQGRGRFFRIDTQCASGVLDGHTSAGSRTITVGGEVFPAPSTADILGCNTGPFTTGPSPLRNAIIPRLAAAFARTSLLLPPATTSTPTITTHPTTPDTFYARDPANHYARLVHAANVDAKGYAFAYDDVQPEGGDDQSGKVNAGDPLLLTVTVGGTQHLSGGGGGGGGYQRPPMPLPPPQGGDQQQQQQQQGGEYARPPMPLPPPDQQRSRPPPPPPKSHALKEKLGSLRDKFLR